MMGWRDEGMMAGRGMENGAALLMLWWSVNSVLVFLFVACLYIISIHVPEFLYTRYIRQWLINISYLC